MTRRGYGRRIADLPASCPAEICDAVERTLNLWANMIELVRTRSPAGRPVRFDHTLRRRRSVQAVLMGLYHRAKVSEAELADAIRAYAAEPWHAKQRAWMTLTDWLASENEDGLLRWVVDGRVAAEQQAKAADVKAFRAAASRRVVGPEATLHLAAEAELERLTAVESDRLVELERQAFEGLPVSVRRTILSGLTAAETPSVRTSRTVRVAVLRALAAELQARQAEPARPVGEVLPELRSPTKDTKGHQGRLT